MIILSANNNNNNNNHNNTILTIMGHHQQQHQQRSRRSRRPHTTNLPRNSRTVTSFTYYSYYLLLLLLSLSSCCCYCGAASFIVVGKKSVSKTKREIAAFLDVVRTKPAVGVGVCNNLVGRRRRQQPQQHGSTPTGTILTTTRNRLGRSSLLSLLSSSRISRVEGDGSTNTNTNDDDSNNNRLILTTTTTTRKKATTQQQQQQQKPISTVNKNDSFSFIRRCTDSNKNDGEDDEDNINSNTDIDNDSNSNSEEREFYDIGVDGTDFRTGELSLKYYNAIVEKIGLNDNKKNNNNNPAPAKTSAIIWDDTMIRSLVFQMTIQDATKAILKQNGMELRIDNDDSTTTKNKYNNNNNNSNNDHAIWNSLRIDTIRIFPSNTEVKEPIDIYDTCEDAVKGNGWMPGQNYDFIVRQVPARVRQLSASELLAALDPDGTYHAQAKLAGIELPVDDDADADEYDDASLHGIKKYNKMRSERPPLDVASSDTTAYDGNNDKKSGYRIIKASALSKPPGKNGENEKVVMQVMNALVNHGCLIVDVTKDDDDDNDHDHEDSSLERVNKLAGMWKVTQEFFEQTNVTQYASSLPPLQTAVGTGSGHAKVGYASYDNNNMQVLETRRMRTTNCDNDNNNNNTILLQPEHVIDNPKSLVDAFDMVTDIGKDIIRIVVAASTLEATNTDGGGTMMSMSPEAASYGAQLLADELIDDGKPLPLRDSNEITYREEPVCMSPHRLCRYSNNNIIYTDNNNKDNVIDSNNPKRKQKSLLCKEIFGAHTDSTFVTAVPVAAVAGLEVYDEGADRWYRPELNAKKHYYETYHHRSSTKNQNSSTSTIISTNEDDDDIIIPWHARYVVYMPGELLQIVSRNEVVASVHRVVVAPAATAVAPASSGSKDGYPPSTDTTTTTSRLSAPILLRGRLGVILNCTRYVGDISDSPLLQEANGMTIETIYAALQPSAFG